ncbi:MAG: hypothetical protein A3F40_04220 [Chlamydiae bacterium RIFCSPHIGHO2_12_FULL_27_8]|nr:MAG: hypothetical protein A3F40_04220 [Chlamydiae bacterium RIFCSPHIGHO2_12_FULL_27_8]
MKFKIFLFLLTLNIFSNPIGEKIVSGKIEIKREDSKLLILQNSDKAIINWEDFSINFNEITKIISQNDKATLLNRVISSNPSLIYGKLEANSNVLLLNQNGILISKSGIVDCRKVLFSTLELSDNEFLFSKDLYFKSNSDKKIINEGVISAIDDVFIISKDIENSGSINSNQTTDLIAANEILLVEGKYPKIFVSLKSDGKISNTGNINALDVKLIAAQGNIFSLAINQEGIIDAKDIVAHEGRVYLSSDLGILNLNGTIKSKNIVIEGENINLLEKAIIDASTNFGNSKVCIGGGFQGNDKTIKNAKTVLISEGSKIFANSLKENNAGRVIIFSEEKTIFKGFISAVAAGNSGNGGFVEISSRHHLKNSGSVDLRSMFGTNGYFVLDPGAVDIIHSDSIESGFDTFSDSFINQQLILSNLEISTNVATNDLDEIITVNEGVNIHWLEDTTFSLTAKKSIIINSNVVIQNTSENNFLAIDFNTLEDNGNFSGIFINSNSQIKVNSADINLSGKGGNVLNDNYGIHLKGRIISENLSEIKNQITLFGSVGRADDRNYPIYLDGGFINVSNSILNINVSNLATKELNHGIYFENMGKIFSTNSILNLQAYGSGTNSTGINFLKGQIRGFGDSIINLKGKGISSPGIYVSQDTYIISENDINFETANSVYIYGQIESNSKVSIKIGLEENGIVLLKNNIYSDNVEISGHDYNDSFCIDVLQNCTINGGNGINTIFCPDYNNNITISDFDVGSINNEINFSNIQNIKGSTYHDDNFVILSDGHLSGFIDGNGGINSLRAPEKNNVWNILSLNSGNIQNITEFQNIQNLFGNNLQDEFYFNFNASISGVINGSGGYCLLDFSNLNQSVVVDLHTKINISKIIGSNFENTMLAPEMENIWYITDRNAGSVNETLFEKFQNITGCGLNDIFYVLENGSLDGVLNGRLSINTLYAPNKDNIINITALNRGYIENVLTFENIQNIYGGNLNNSVNFFGSASISGILDANSQNQNILNFTLYNNPAVIDLKKYKNFNDIKGNNESTLIADNLENTFEITNPNYGKLNESITFSNIHNIIGGNLNDYFTINYYGSMDGTIDGSLGSNTLFIKKENLNWITNDINSGYIEGLVNFKNISNYKSYSHALYTFSNEGYNTGIIDGGGDSIIDFSLNTTPQVIDLKKLENITHITGSSALDTLIGKDENNVWNVTGENSGTIKNIQFENIENLKGGQFSDIFVFHDQAFLSGEIDGGNSVGSMNVIDYSLCQNPVKADILTGEASKVDFASNIQAAILPNFIPQDLLNTPKIVEIPLDETNFENDFFDRDFLDYFSNPNILSSYIDFQEGSYPIYISKNKNNVLVYRASSPLVISKKTMTKIYKKANASIILTDINIGETAIRMKNNLKKAIDPKKIAIRGEMKQVDAVYKQDINGMDTDEVEVQVSSSKERSIKQRPRNLHYYNK